MLIIRSKRIATVRWLARRGSASIDYVLVLGTLATLGGISLYLGSKIIRLAYDMVCAFVGWPFL